MLLLRIGAGSVLSDMDGVAFSMPRYDGTASTADDEARTEAHTAAARTEEEVITIYKYYLL